jgi:hypothetical protein
MVRRISRFTGRHFGLIFVALLGLCVFGFLPPLFPPQPALADQQVDDLKALALSGTSLNRRLAVVDKLKSIGSTGARDALVAIAKGGDLPIQAAACAALGRMKTSGSKDDLKSVLEDSNLSDQVRLSAGTCIAVHWKDSGDMTYLEDHMKGSDALKDQYSYLKTQVYGYR